MCVCVCVREREKRERGSNCDRQIVAEFIVCRKVRGEINRSIVICGHIHVARASQEEHFCREGAFGKF